MSTPKSSRVPSESGTISVNSTPSDENLNEKFAHLSTQLSILERRNTRLERYLLLQQALSEIFAQTKSPHDLNIQVLQAICESTGWDFGEIWQIDTENNVLVCNTNWQPNKSYFPQFEAMSRQITFAPGIGLPGRVWVNTQPLWIPNVQEDTNFPRAPVAAKDGLYTGVGLPIHAKGKLFGIMGFFTRMIRLPDDELLQLLATVTQHVGLFMERKHQESLEQEELRLSIELEQRLHVARDLQRTVSQPLFSALIMSEFLPYLWDRDLNKIWFGLGEIRKLTHTSVVQMNKLFAEIGAESLAQVEAADLLDKLIKKATDQTHFKIALTIKGECRLGLEEQVSIYGFVQETLQNVVQHARATQASVTLFSYSSSIELRITDNGRGFNPAVVLPDRLGLRIMRECAEKLNAEFELDSRLNHGTSVMLRWHRPVR